MLLYFWWIFMGKYYAIKANDKKLIVNTWDEAKLIIKDLKSPKYKSFSTIEEAEAFLSGIEIVNDENISGVVAYIDGSFDLNTKAYSFGGVLLIDGKEYRFKKKYEEDEYSSLRNVAGEIKGAGYIINYCINHGIKELHLFYDYLGIEKWYNKTWKAKSTIAIEYVNFVDTVKDKIKVIFHKVKSHTNNYYNDMADMLAKEALGI